MQEYNTEQIKIGDNVIEKLVDEYNISWYPLASFLQTVLKKSKSIKNKEEKFGQYMRLIEYHPINCKGDALYKTWFINETGIKEFLKKTSIEGDSNTRSFKKREKNFAEACAYFQVKIPKEIRPTFISSKPPLSGYNLWARLCIEHDPTINGMERWKLCKQCDRYYPYKPPFFGEKLSVESKCLKCQKKDFRCKNKILQFLYDNNGYELIKKIYMKGEPIEVDECKRFIWSNRTK